MRGRLTGQSTCSLVTMTRSCHGNDNEETTVKSDAVRLGIDRSEKRVCITKLSGGHPQCE